MHVLAQAPWLQTPLAQSAPVVHGPPQVPWVSGVFGLWQLERHTPPGLEQKPLAQSAPVVHAPPQIPLEFAGELAGHTSTQNPPLQDPAWQSAPLLHAPPQKPLVLGVVPEGQLCTQLPSGAALQ